MTWHDAPWIGATSGVVIIMAITVWYVIGTLKDTRKSVAEWRDIALSSHSANKKITSSLNDFLRGLDTMPMAISDQRVVANILLEQVTVQITQEQREFAAQHQRDDYRGIRYVEIG